MLVALLVTLAALAVTVLAARRARARSAAVAAAAGRLHAAAGDLSTAREEFDAAAAKLAAVLAVDRLGPGRAGGFGDGHVRRARLRAALATTPDGAEL